jgi:phage terminase large subunit-like protein
MPQHIITTTPKPTPLILNLAKVPNQYRIVQKSTTFDNEKNLAPGMIRALKERHGNSKYARQELYGEILSQMDGALFSKDAIDANRSTEAFENLHFYTIVIGVDPAVTFGEEADMTGIVVIGQAPNGHCYVIEDATMRGKPEEWAAKVNELSNKYSAKYQRPLVVAESNNGGEMISSVLKIENPELRVKLVTATKGKTVRAEPVSIAYSKGLVHHLGTFPELELEMLYWIPGKSLNSPNRLDALVWAVTELVENPNTAKIYFLRISNICMRCGMPSPKSFKVCQSCHLPLIEDS